MAKLPAIVNMSFSDMPAVADRAGASLGGCGQSIFRVVGERLLGKSGGVSGGIIAGPVPVVVSVKLEQRPWRQSRVGIVAAGERAITVGVVLEGLRPRLLGLPVDLPSFDDIGQAIETVGILIILSEGAY